MEKRWCERIPVPLSVVIYHNRFRVAKCRVKNLSLCGICLESGPLAYYKNTEILIEFPDTGYLPGNSNIIKATVARNAHQEIGLMFNPTLPVMINSIIKQFRNDDLKLVASASS